MQVETIESGSEVEVETIDEQAIPIVSSNLMAATSSHLQIIEQYSFQCF